MKLKAPVNKTVNKTVKWLRMNYLLREFTMNSFFKYNFSMDAQSSCPDWKSTTVFKMQTYWEYRGPHIRDLKFKIKRTFWGLFEDFLKVCFLCVWKYPYIFPQKNQNMIWIWPSYTVGWAFSRNQIFFFRELLNPRFPPGIQTVYRYLILNWSNHLRWTRDLFCEDSWC